MPDISMCMKKDCPSFTRCYRAQAKPDEHWQSYSSFDNGDADFCSHFIAIRSVDRRFNNSAKNESS